MILIGGFFQCMLLIHFVVLLKDLLRNYVKSFPDKSCLVLVLPGVDAARVFIMVPYQLSSVSGRSR